MLKEILESKSDSAVLGFFLSAPKRAFSITEISKLLRLKPMKTAFSLNRLVAAGLLKSFSKRGKKYFIINNKPALLAEVKREVKIQSRYKDKLSATVKSLGNIKAAFLSGLFCAQPGLPVDLLLVGRVNLKKLSDFLKISKKMMGQEINYSIMTEDEFLLRRNTFDKFIKDIFDYPHLVICDRLRKN